MIITFPHPAERYDPDHARQLVEQLERAFQRVHSIESTAPYLLLTSPDQSVFKVTVTDAGTLTSVKLPKGRPVA